jgi:hypothetical protein
MKKKPAPGEGAGWAGGKKNGGSGHIDRPAQTAQHPPKPSVCRAVAPPLHQYYSGNAVTTILEAVALHLRCTIPVLSDLTLNDFDTALADLRPQIRELLDVKIREEVEEELIMREMEREET